MTLCGGLQEAVQAAHKVAEAVMWSFYHLVAPAMMNLMILKNVENNSDHG